MDEAVFSSAQVKPKIWFVPQSTPVEMTKKKIGFGAIAVAAAIDVHGKVIAYHIQDHSIDTDAYIMFLTRVRDYTKGKKCVMLVDNLRVHRTDPSKAACERFNIDQVFNGTYSSTFNPIERLWAFSKRRFTRRCAAGAPYHNQTRMRKLVREILLEDYSSPLRKRVITCMESMRLYLESKWR